MSWTHVLISVTLLISCAGESTPADAPAAAPEAAPADGQAAPPADAHTADNHGADAEVEATADAEGWFNYGAAFTVAADQTLACASMLGDPAAHEGKPLRVSGRVADVCQKKGCWMVLTPPEGDAGDQLIRVTMKEHGFGVNKQGSGQTAEVEGVLKKVEPDPDTVAHFESEAADKTKVPETRGQTWELVATAVRMRPAGG